MDKRYFSKKIVEWYQLNKRLLPWRATNDPYKIWLSEIILQQTRINQGLPYYHRFVAKYPTVEQLASAPEQEILRLWQGLGYYTRARNLHACAKKLSLAPEFPNTFNELKKLPGIGDYTAAAIASFSFGERIAVVDGNVYRLLSRLFGIDTAINTAAGRKQFFELANDLISADDPGIYNQAMMEFGATWCVPGNPDCKACIFNSNCFAFRHSLQRRLPVKIKARESRKRYFHYLVFKKGRSLLMKKRTAKDIWFGLYDFPLIEKNKPLNLREVWRRSGSPNAAVRGKNSITESETYRQVLTHQIIICKFFIIEGESIPGIGVEASKFYTFRRISELPKPVLISRFLNEYSFYS